MPSPLFELTRTRLLEYARSPSALFWVFGFPLLLVVVLGVAFQGGAAPSYRAAWVSAHGSPPPASDMLTFKPLSDASARRALAIGDVDLTVIDHGTQGALPSYTFQFDDSQSRSLPARLLVELALRRQATPRASVLIATEHPQRIGERYIDFLLPGVIGLALLTNSMKTVAFAVVESRRNRLLKSYAGTPMRRSDYLLSFIIMRVLFLIGEVGILLLAARVLFDIRVQGSAGVFLVLCLGGASCFTGMALALAARIERPESARNWIKVVEVPMWFLSGTFFAYSRYPAPLQPAIKLLPLTSFNDALRSVMTQPVGASAIWPQVLVLTGWAVASFVFALRFFKWQ